MPEGCRFAVNTGSASPPESTLVAPLFDFMVRVDFPEKLLGDKACDADRLDEKLAEMKGEMISPHRSRRKPENKTQDGRKLRGYMRRRTVEPTVRLAAKLPAALRPPGEIDLPVSRLCSSHLFPSSHKRGLGLASKFKSIFPLLHKNT